MCNVQYVSKCMLYTHTYIAEICAFHVLYNSCVSVYYVYVHDNRDVCTYVCACMYVIVCGRVLVRIICTCVSEHVHVC